jgi:hypothetical protein
VEALEERCLLTREPLLLIHGIFGSWEPGTLNFPTTAWSMQRGYDPTKLVIDPLTGAYTPIISYLQSAAGGGYTIGKDLFIANYDWRLPLAPDDGTFDGKITGITAQDMVSGNYQYGLDYLGYWLNQAASVWNQANPGQTLDHVNVIAHSMGNILTRSYIQSTAYGGAYTIGGQTLHLPTIDNFVMVSPPNQGATNTWNGWHDNFSISSSYVNTGIFFLSNAWNAVSSGSGQVTGPTTITKASITVGGQVSSLAFLNQYGPTLQELGPIYNFLITPPGSFVNVNNDPNSRSDILLDLNGDPTNAWLGLTGKNTEIYGTTVATPSLVLQNVGVGGTVIGLATGFGSHATVAGETWWKDLIGTNNGDGTVPLNSLESVFVGDPRISMNPFRQGVNTTGPVEHAAILGNTDVQTLIGNTLRPQTLFLAVGADAGGGPHVRVFDAVTGLERFSFFAFDPGFLGGVRVAVGDVNGDGVPDIVVGAGPGGGPHVKVFSGTDGSVLASFMAFNAGFTGGVTVAVGNLDNDNADEIVVGAGASGGPNVRSFKFSITGAVPVVGPIGDFFAFDVGFTGGVNVAVGNFDGSGADEIVVGAGAGGGPNVRVFRTDGTRIADFFAYGLGFTGGVNVAAGDLNGDGKDEIVTGAGAGGGPEVSVFNGGDATLLAAFFAFDPVFLGGVRVAMTDVTQDGHQDIVAAAGPGGGPDLREFNGATLAQITSFFTFETTFQGGLHVGATD